MRLMGLFFVLLSQILSSQNSLAEALPGMGSLMLENDQQQTHAALLRDMDVKMDISGVLARVTVAQHFTNTSPDWVEGLYLMPLPDDASVDKLVLIIGERRIESEIQEKQQALNTYNQARNAGKQSALLEFIRPNLFHTKVANIAPGETVTIEVSYAQIAQFQDKHFQLRLPLTLTPRFHAGQALSGGEAIPDPGLPTTQNFHDQALETPQFSLKVHLDAGIPTVSVNSLYHPISVWENGKQSFEIELAMGLEPGNRDFVLQWQPDGGKEPLSALFSQTLNGESYWLMMLVPQTPEMIEPQARELIFIIDTSGSMFGPSIQQAQSALKMALQELKTGDFFNIIEFNTDAQALWSESQTVTEQNLEEARHWIQKLQAEGGTNMAPALKQAFAMNEPANILRQIVFITDGSIRNEQALFSLIHQNIQDYRLFTVGIGAAPNTWFMRKAAESGRGSYTAIGKLDEVEEKMLALFDKLRFPAITSIKTSWPDAVESYPSIIPDLYAGEPLIILAKTPENLPGHVLLDGQLKLQPWSKAMPLNQALSSNEIARLWTQSKIQSLLDLQWQTDSPDAYRDDILPLALSHNLITPYTSLVAVDQTPARSQKAKLMRKLASQARPQAASPDTEIDAQMANMALPQTALGLPKWWLIFVLSSLIALWVNRQLKA